MPRSKRSKTSRRKGKKSALSYPSSSSSLYQAPVAVTSLRPRPHLSFTSSKKADIVLNGCVLSPNYIDSYGIGATKYYLFHKSATEGAVTNTCAMLLDPSFTSGYFLPDNIATLCQQFMRFKFTKFIIHYEPACATSTNGNMVLAYIPDGNLSYSTSSSNVLAGVSDLLVSPIWMPGSLDVTRTMNEAFIEPLYTSDPSTVTSANNRQSVQGKIMIADDIATNINANYVNIGRLWFEFSLELFGFGQYQTLGARRPDDEKKSSPPDSTVTLSQVVSETQTTTVVSKPSLPSKESCLEPEYELVRVAKKGLSA